MLSGFGVLVPCPEFYCFGSCCVRDIVCLDRATEPNSGFCGDIGSWEGTGNAS